MNLTDHGNNPDLSGYDEDELRAKIKDIVDTKLPDGRKRQLFYYRYGLGGSEPHTLSETAAHYGISTTRILEIENGLVCCARTRMLGYLRSRGLLPEDN